MVDELVGPTPEVAIPVPKSLGKMWKKKIDDAISTYQMEWQIWEDAYRRYRRSSQSGIVFDDGREYADVLSSDVDENLVRQNTKSLMRDAYMQNPNIELTPEAAHYKDFVKVVDKAINYIINKDTYPGVNLKPKMRRWILHGVLTNYGVIRLDYQEREGSLEDVAISIAQVEQKIMDARATSDLSVAYAELDRLYDELPVAGNSGMSLVNCLPHRVIVDPDCTMIDLSDADWLAEEVHLDTDYIRRTYMLEEGDAWVFRQDTSVVVESGGGGDVQTEVLSQVLESSSDERIEVVAKNKTRCYMIYDKLMRRIYLFSEDNWKTPLWVWEDTLRLSRFFRHFFLAFTETVDGIVQPGEVAQYTGIEDQINKVNRQVKRIRQTVFGALLYNKNVIKSETADRAAKLMRNPSEFHTIPVDLPPDVDLSKAMHAFAPPAMQYKELFDTRNLRAAIDRAAETTEIDRGGEFRTNTTNEAILAYSNIKQQKTDVVVGAIEEAMDALGWSMCEVLVSKYSPEDIQDLIGPEYVEGFTPMSVKEFNRTCRMQIASGSIQKPTTQYKKEEALNIAQALGQMGQAAPTATLKIMLKLFQKAFSGLFVSEQDWKELEREGEANLTKGQSVEQSAQLGRTGHPNRGVGQQ